jgi:shikimate 5-dehydrogenase
MQLQVHIDLPIRELVHFVVGCVPAQVLDAGTCSEWGGDPSFIDYAYVRSGTATSLMVAADSRGAVGIDGRELLVRQGAAALRVWLPDARPPIEVMLRATR